MRSTAADPFETEDAFGPNSAPPGKATEARVLGKWASRAKVYFDFDSLASGCRRVSHTLDRYKGRRICFQKTVDLVFCKNPPFGVIRTVRGSTRFMVNPVPYGSVRRCRLRFLCFLDWHICVEHVRVAALDVRLHCIGQSSFARLDSV